MSAKTKATGALAAAAIAALLTALAVPAEASASPYRVLRNISYDLGSPPRPPSTPAMNRLDLYLPRGSEQRSRPVVVWAHAGGWRKGNKRVGIRKKATFFTRAGYVFASVNYRLSTAPFDPLHPDPRRVMFPAQPRDLGEAVAWLASNAREFGGDPRRIVLTGHSAGAHLAALVATDRRYIRRYRPGFRSVAGFVALDAPAFDIAAAADPAGSGRPEEGREMLWNAFGTAAENATTRSWRRASPLRFAGPNDPPALLVTQADNAQRLRDHERMARALGRSPGRVVFPVALDHRQIGRALGDRADRSGETARVRSFVRRVVR